MRAAARGILAIDRVISAATLNIACLLLAVICSLGIWQVLARFVLSEPSSWTEEVLRRLLIWCVMLGTVVAFRRGALVSVDLMLRLSTGTWRSIVRLVILVATLLFLGVMLWYGADLAWRVRFQTFASVDWSMGWAYAAIPVGAALSMLAVIAEYFDPMNTELEAAQ